MRRLLNLSHSMLVRTLDEEDAARLEEDLLAPIDEPRGARRRRPPQADRAAQQALMAAAMMPQEGGR